MSKPFSTTHDVIDSLVPLAGLRVADIGSGEGDLCRWFVVQGAAEVVGIECGAAMLAEARRRGEGPNLRFAEGVGQDLPLADDSVDLVVFSNSLHHVPEAEQGRALAEAARVVRKGAQVLVLEPVAAGPYFELLQPVHDETRVRARARAEMDAAVASGRLQRVEGFEFERAGDFESFDAFRDRVIRINPHLREAVHAAEPTLRDAFVRLGTHDRGRWRFPQPIRVDLFRA